MKKSHFHPVDVSINFSLEEEKLLKDWYEKGTVDKYLHRNDASKKRFSFFDGPITANNPMGVHHAWGRSFKDLWQRYHNMKGYRQRFQNGFDCQGLWVEVEVEKELGLKTKKDIENLVPGDKKASIAQFVELCKNRVRKFSAIQTEQSKRLGYIVDWSHSYYTMSDENNYMIWHFLKVCHEKGWLYKGRESVPWCPRCQTAISQHEMLTEDYKEVVHKSIYMEFRIVGREKEYLLVWTTTPWTIPANIAVAVDKNLDYCLVRGNSGNLFWIVKERIEAVFGKEYESIVKTVKGKELVGLRYSAPFDDLPAIEYTAKDHPKMFHTVVATDPLLMPVSVSEGTGLVHTAVSAGSEDFKLGKKYGLPMIPVISDTAEYVEGLGFLTGLNAKKHPEIILDYMQKRNDEGKDCVFKIENYKHRYPACWRCKTELVWKVADEWYIAMDVPEGKGKSLSAGKAGEKGKGMTLRDQMMETARQITWKPEFGLKRELEWLGNMHDWLISKKNRYWGLALPIYECAACKHVTVIGSKEELEKRAIGGWKEFHGHSPHKPFIDEVSIRCEKCGSEVSRIDDVGNVWLDAGIIGFSTLIDPGTGKLSYTTDKKYWKQWYPADFITESFPGQFKNWFYSMIAMSTVLEKKTCFRTVLGYASMLGEDGRPMHKSWGNAIEFNDGADKIGADVMRWMFARHNPEQNLLFGYRLADETRRKFHLLLWNVYNFFVTYANLDRYSPVRHAPSDNILDRWILARLDETIHISTISLDEYDAFHAAEAMENYVSDLSQWYVRRSRSRVGPAASLREDATSCHQTLHTALSVFCRLLAPINPFIADMMYVNLTGEESVHLASWPVLSKKWRRDQNVLDQMEHVRSVCEKGHALRKELKMKVRQPLAALTVRNCPVSSHYYHLIQEELNVKSVRVEDGSGESSVQFDTQLTRELKMEGEIRELIRSMQILRKEKKTPLDAVVQFSVPHTYASYDPSLIDMVKSETVSDIVWGESLEILTG